MTSVVANCPLCDTSVPDSHPYLAKMSFFGKLFGKLPNNIASLLPSQNFKKRFEHGKKMIRVFESKHWHYCPECSFGFAAPKLSKEELSNYYSDNYWTVRNSLALKNAIYNEENLKRPSDQLAFMQQNGLQRVESMLDFGAGMCGAAALFRRENFCNDVTILDPSKQAEIVAQLLDMSRLSSFENVDGRCWELVYSSHSLEHVTDVKEVLGTIHRLLVPGGYLFIEVPNIPNKTVLTEFHHAPHTFCFSKKSLTRVADESGFDLIKAVEYGDTFQSRMSIKHKELEVSDSLMALFGRRDSV